MYVIEQYVKNNINKIGIENNDFAQNKERAVPKNSTCMTISVQPEAFTTGLSNFGYTMKLSDVFIQKCHFKYQH